ncbi:MAG TPA: aldo/keto reductase [Longimicrobiales bacterium]|nr:aldo/keto reductase [Longimicrobiales bacterium]
MTDNNRHPTRREALRIGAAAALGLTVGRLPLHAAPYASLAASRSGGVWADDLITKAIPSSGERIPVVGLGTNRYSVTEEADLAARRAVLRRMPDLGLTVVDTAPSYGRSEEVIGQLTSEIGNRDRLWIATKVTARDNDVQVGTQMLNDSFRKLRTDRVELMQVHNLNGTEVMLPVMREWKQDGRIRYIGVTTSSDRQYEELERIMRSEDLDFIQVDYSIGNRTAGERILPLAQDRGMAVLLNLPFGGARGNVVVQMGERPLPDWAAEFGAASWAQVFLKYDVSHPAVTAAIPGTTNVRHLEDNAAAARGELPDAAMRRRIEQFFDAL